jgi:hypothetical protein
VPMVGTSEISTRLRSALETFERLRARPLGGTRQVSVASHRRLRRDRIGGIAPGPAPPRELHVVRPAADGLANRDIVAPRTPAIRRDRGR